MSGVDPNDQSFDGFCPTCGQKYLGEIESDLAETRLMLERSQLLQALAIRAVDLSAAVMRAPSKSAVALEALREVVEQTERTARMGSTDRAKLNFLVLGYERLRELLQAGGGT